MCEAKPTNHTRPFLLVSSQRSGSTWLIDSLSSLPCLALQREMFLLHGNARVSCSTRERETFCRSVQSKWLAERSYRFKW